MVDHPFPSTSSASSQTTLLSLTHPPQTPLALIAREDSLFAKSLSSKTVTYPSRNEHSSRDRTWSHLTTKSSLTISTTASLSLRSSPSSPNARLLAAATATPDVFGPGDLVSMGTDSQGIPWSRFSIAREDYRLRRMQEVSNYNNVTWTARLEHQRRRSIQAPAALREWWTFARNYRTIQPSIDHFQLRQLLYTPDNVHGFFVANSVLMRVNKVTGEVVRVHAQSGNQMACVHVAWGLAVSGAFDSEVVVSSLPASAPIDNPGSLGESTARLQGTRHTGATSAGSTDAGNSAPPPRPAARMLFRKKVSIADNSITNSVLLVSDTGREVTGGYSEPAALGTGSVRLLVGNNDQTLKEFDVSQAGHLISTQTLPWPVNHVSAKSNLLCVAGDTCDLTLLDRRSPGEVGKLSGHLDFAFCSDWSPKNDFTVATGSQDGTCRVYDVRRSDQPVHVLGTVVGAARSVKFSPCGGFLAFSEPADYVHIYDAKCGYEEAQVLDFFGNVAGIAFSPDASRLSVSVADSMFGCLMEFRRSTRCLN